MSWWPKKKVRPSVGKVALLVRVSSKGEVRVMSGERMVSRWKIVRCIDWKSYVFSIILNVPNRRGWEASEQNENGRF